MSRIGIGCLGVGRETIWVTRSSATPEVLSAGTEIWWVIGEAVPADLAGDQHQRQDQEQHGVRPRQSPEPRRHRGHKHGPEPGSRSEDQPVQPSDQQSRCSSRGVTSHLSSRTHSHPLVAGSTMANVDPWPGTLSSVTRPPCHSATWRTIQRPRPRPSATSGP